MFEYIRLFLKYLRNLLSLDSAAINEVRAVNDHVLSPIVKRCIHFHIHPVILSTLSFLLGLVAIFLLFHNYFYFIGVMLISAFIDILNASLTRQLPHTDQFNRRYDVISDLAIMLLMTVALSIHFHFIIGIFAALFYAVVFTLNLLAKEPCYLSSGRQIVFLPTLFFIPQAGLVLIGTYAMGALLLIAREKFYFLQGKPLQGETKCQQASPVINLIELNK